MTIQSTNINSNQLDLFKSLPTEIRFLILSNLDEKTLAVSSEINRQFYVECTQDPLWKNQLRQRNIRLIEGQSKSQLVQRLRSFCSIVLNQLELVDEYKGKQINVFELRENLDRLINLDIVGNMLKKIEELLSHITHFPEGIDHSKTILKVEKLVRCIIELEIFNFSKMNESEVNIKVTPNTVLGMIINKMPEDILIWFFNNLDSFPIQYLMCAIHHKLSPAIVNMIIDETRDFSPYDSLGLALHLRYPDSVIMKLMSKTSIKTDHLSEALTQEYPMPIIDLLFKEILKSKTKITDITDDVIRAAVQSKNPEHNSERFIRLLLDKASALRDEDFLCVLLEKQFSDEVIKLYINKICNMEFPLNYIIEAHRRGYSHEILQLIIEKGSAILETNSYSWGQSAAHAGLRSLLQTQGFPEGLLLMIIQKFPDFQLEPDVIEWAKQNNWSKAIMEELHKKCKKIESSCAIM